MVKCRPVFVGLRMCLCLVLLGVFLCRLSTFCGGYIAFFIHIYVPCDVCLLVVCFVGFRAEINA